MSDKGKCIDRCVNIDWLEVYCLESNERFPCNADYFESQGYMVKRREYGTRVYREMFYILDENSDPVIEIRRNPASGESEFQGLSEYSTHIRLQNWVLYRKDPIQFLREFLLRHDYIFKRIYRIDICYDFEFFDSGDAPAKFARRYMRGVYRKINQCNLSTYGSDSWSSYEVNSLSWGAKASMVSTKLYNKTLELKEAKNDKPWIKTCWMVHGLIDNPTSMTKRNDKGEVYSPEIWRVEFSMKSDADRWIVLDMTRGAKTTKRSVPHSLSMFDEPYKLWARFQNLAYNYFHFKYKEYVQEEPKVSMYALEKVHSDHERKLQRKDRCRDKILFKFDTKNEFFKLSAVPSVSAIKDSEAVLRRRLEVYRARTSDRKTHDACTIVLESLERLSSLRFLPMGDPKERRVLQLALAQRLGGDERSATELIARIRQIIEDEDIW